MMMKKRKIISNMKISPLLLMILEMVLVILIEDPVEYLNNNKMMIK